MKQPTWLFCFSKGKYGMPWERSEVAKIPFIVQPTFSSKRDLTATIEVQASLARSPIKFCNHKTQQLTPSTRNGHLQKFLCKHTLEADRLRDVSPPVLI